MNIFILSYNLRLLVSTNYVACYDNHSSFTHPAPSSESRFLNLDLNCIVLGDDPTQVFTVQIAKTKNFSALKKVIKDEKQHAFEHVDADTLNLWKVSTCCSRRVVSDKVAFGRSISI